MNRQRPDGPVPAVTDFPSLFRRRLAEFAPVQAIGSVIQVVGQVVEARGPAAHLGDLCLIETDAKQWPAVRGHRSIPAEVVGFRRDAVLLMPLAPLGPVRQGSRVLNQHRSLMVPVGPDLLGRVLDPLGRPIDGRGPIRAAERYPLERAAPAALDRPRIDRPLPLGVRAIDALLTVGRGQRLGIFAGSGVGKSTLLGSIARGGGADVNVVALVGERGREVREFVERDLGEGLARSVVVVATSDQPAVMRLKGAYAATAIAEYFRDQGAQVMLMMDSVTRFAWAQREIGLAIGEPPTTRGYTPSVLAALPQLLERAGASGAGSITGLYTVLVDGDDLNEPVADTVRGILDGHIVLRRELATQGHYPAIDVLESISRCMVDVAETEHAQAALEVRGLLAAHREAADLIRLGAYVAGTDPRVDRAVARYEALRDFLIQAPDERCPWEETIGRLRELAA
jgi:flagellum-specific ATP synthase